MTITLTEKELMELKEISSDVMNLSDEEVEFELDNRLNKIPNKENIDIDECFNDREVLCYLRLIELQYIKNKDNLIYVSIKSDPENKNEICLDYDMNPPQFQRIRRITGYLVGTLDRFNNAKRHEEHDRIKHTDKNGKSFLR